MAEQRGARADGEDREQPQGRDDRRPGSDVELDVPSVKVDDLHLDVEHLQAHVALDTAVAENLVRIRAGVDVDLGKVQLEIKGVDVEAQLRVKLDNVARIVQEALTTLRESPGVIAAINGADAEMVKQLGSSPGSIRKTTKAAARKLKRGVAQVAGQITGRLGAPHAAY